MVTLRPLRPTEADAALALWTRSAPLDPVPRSVLVETLWGPPAGTVLAAEVGGETVGLGVGVRWPVEGAVRGSVRALVVAPERRRAGVGTALMDALEADLRQRGASVVRLVEAAPTYLTPGVDVRNEGSLAFAATRGYRDLGEAVNLGVDLGADDWRTEADDARLAAEAVEVRRAAEADRPTLAALLRAHWPAWQAEADAALALGPPALHLALRDGDVLGFAAHSANNAALGWFGPMGTAPEARGLGIGAVLLRRCLADLRDAGFARATIGWAAALPFYERTAGATVERRFRRFEKPL